MAHKIGVADDKDSTLPFKLFGFGARYSITRQTIHQTTEEVAKNEYGVIYITKQYTALSPETVKRYKEQMIPAIVLIPNHQGSLGIGLGEIQKGIEKAVGQNVLQYEKGIEILQTGKIIKVSGPLIMAENVSDASTQNMCLMGDLGAVGKITKMRGNVVSIQVYEEASGVGPDELVHSTDEALPVELGLGVTSQMFDGIQRLSDAFMGIT